ncbi:DUF3606 domain-containing protein [Muricoccus nepalensis]|nr:DUF3606 domain-containing protein [Roseomonas nepalensis]
MDSKTRGSSSDLRCPVVGAPGAVASHHKPCPKVVWLASNTIDMDDDINARYWARVFQLSNLDLATAVMIVGPDARAVAQFLGNAGSRY